MTEMQSDVVLPNKSKVSKRVYEATVKDLYANEVNILDGTFKLPEFMLGILAIQNLQFEMTGSLLLFKICASNLPRPL